jgi:hypothetical protein
MIAPTLFHVSEEASISVFVPRPSTVFPSLGSVVWAVAESHLVNYLLPRDCPRVTFGASRDTTDADRGRFNLAGSSRVIVIACNWIERVNSAAIYVYELSAMTFTPHDASAGYWLSREPVVPIRVSQVAHVPHEIRRRGADLRVVDRLKPLKDQVVASTLDYSIIRMRNAER